MGALRPILGIVLAFALAWLLVRLTLAWTRRHGMFDLPGRRRSHATPTPRGGGLGLLAAGVPIAAFWWLHGPQPESAVTVAAILIAVVMVAAIGWRDDRVHVSAQMRFGVHMAAAVLAAWAVLHGLGFWPASETALLGAALALAMAWSINAHNFMDGIDTLLGLQALFCFLAFACLALAAGQVGHAGAAWGLAAACVGFLPFNWSPARIFMGDVGSGTVGLLIAVVAALLWRRAPAVFWPLAMLCSAFVVDATLTLGSRVLRGRRWYTAHREHLYQWLARRGFSHVRIAMMYMLWNLLIAAPAAALAWVHPARGAWLALAVYAAAIALWFAGRRACLVTLRRKSTC